MLRAARFLHSYLRHPRGRLHHSEVGLEVDGSTVPATLLKPPIDRPLPGWIVLHGITVPGRHHPGMVRFASSLAASGALVLIPEVKGNQCTGITLLHARFADHLDAEVAKQVLAGYRGRYSALVDAVTETEPTFDDVLLARQEIIDLLVQPVHVLAEVWRSGRLA